jgi:hypothetical protein
MLQYLNFYNLGIAAVVLGFLALIVYIIYTSVNKGSFTAHFADILPQVQKVESAPPPVHDDGSRVRKPSPDYRFGDTDSGITKPCRRYPLKPTSTIMQEPSVPIQEMHDGMFELS